MYHVFLRLSTEEYLVQYTDINNAVSLILIDKIMSVVSKYLAGLHIDGTFKFWLFSSYRQGTCTGSSSESSFLEPSFSSSLKVHEKSPLSVWQSCLNPTNTIWLTLTRSGCRAQPLVSLARGPLECSTSRSRVRIWLSKQSSCNWIFFHYRNQLCSASFQAVFCW